MAVYERCKFYLEGGICSHADAPKPYKSGCIGKDDCGAWNDNISYRVKPLVISTTRLFNEKFETCNMKGRPVFYRKINELDSSPISLPLCEDCRQLAKYMIFELNGEKWAWCGECDQGG